MYIDYKSVLLHLVPWQNLGSEDSKGRLRQHLGEGH